MASSQRASLTNNNYSLRPGGCPVSKQENQINYVWMRQKFRQLWSLGVLCSIVWVLEQQMTCHRATDSWGNLSLTRVVWQLLPHKSRGHLELDIAAVRNKVMKNLPHHQNDIPFPSALKRHHSKFFEPFPIVRILQTTHSAGERSLNALYQLYVNDSARVKLMRFWWQSYPWQLPIVWQL